MAVNRKGIEEVKRSFTKAKAGSYRAVRATYTYVQGALKLVEKGQVENLAQGEATAHFLPLASRGPINVGEEIVAALAHFNPNDPAHWTKAGEPLMEKIEELLGRKNISRQDVEEAAPGFSQTTTTLSGAKAKVGKDTLASHDIGAE